MDEGLRFADMKFGIVRFHGQERTLALAILEGELAVGVGRDRAEAMSAMIKDRWPHMEVEVAPQAAMSEALVDKPFNESGAVWVDDGEVIDAG